MGVLWRRSTTGKKLKGGEAEKEVGGAEFPGDTKYSIILGMAGAVGKWPEIMFGMS